MLYLVKHKRLGLEIYTVLYTIGLQSRIINKTFWSEEMARIYISRSMRVTDSHRIILKEVKI